MRHRHGKKTWLRIECCPLCNGENCLFCRRPWLDCANDGSCPNACSLWHALAVLGEKPRRSCPYHRRGCEPT